MHVIPNSEVYDDQGNLSHFAILDPVTGGPALIPHYNDNYIHFGGNPDLRVTGGNGAAMTEAGGNGGGAGDDSDTPDMPINVNAGADATAPTSIVGDMADSLKSGIGSVINQGASMGASTAATAAPVQQPKTASTANAASAPDIENTPAPANVPGQTTQQSGLFPDGKIVTTKEGTSQTSADTSGMRAAEKTYTAATQEKAKADIAESQVKQLQAKQEADAIFAHQQEVAARRAQYEADVAKRQQEISAATDKFMNAKIDANRLWHDASTSDRVMAGIAIVLGGLGGALQGNGGNVGLDVINKAIDRDIKAQELNLNKQQAGVELKRGLLGDYRKEFGDQETAKEAAFIAYQKGVIRQFDAMAAKAAEPGIAATAKQMAAKLQMDNEARIAELSKKTTTSETSTAPTVKPARLPPKETEELSKIGAAYNQLGDLQGKIKENKNRIGPATGRLEKLALSLGMDEGADVNTIDQELTRVLTEARVAKNKGIYPPTIKDDVEALKASIKTNPDRLIDILESEKKGLRQTHDAMYGANSGSYLMPPSAIKADTNDQYKALGITKKK